MNYYIADLYLGHAKYNSNLMIEWKYGEGKQTLKGGKSIMNVRNATAADLEYFSCPNLRWQKQGGFFSAKKYFCSLTKQELDYGYVCQTCNGGRTKASDGKYYGKYAYCQTFKNFGIWG